MSNGPCDVTESPNTRPIPPLEDVLDNIPFEERVRRDAFDAQREAEKHSTKRSQNG